MSGNEAELIGIALCGECGSRYLIREAKKYLLGKSVRCSKCHSIFIVKPEQPTTVENQLSNEPDQEPINTTSRKKRRTKGEMKYEQIKKIHEGFQDMHARLVELNANSTSSEEDVRHWCMDVLRNCLGYEDQEMATELNVLGKHVDIALRKDNRVFMVIETKNIRHNLKNAKEQAAGYAANLGAEWAVATNGQIWRLYKVVPQKGLSPKMLEVFDVALLDEDGVSEADSERLYLLTSRSIFYGDTEKMYHAVAASSPKRLLNAFKSPRVTAAVRKELEDGYKDAFDIKPNLNDADVLEQIIDIFETTEL